MRRKNCLDDAAKSPQKFDWIAMKSPRKSVALLVLSAVVLAGLLLHAQNPPAPPVNPVQGTPANPQAKPVQKAPTIVLNPTEVVVPVTVKDRSGHLVAGLNKEDFRVFEDSVEQHVSHFTADAFPISMVVLIDNDLGRLQRCPAVRPLSSILCRLNSAIPAESDFIEHAGAEFFRGTGDRLAAKRAIELDRGLVLRQRPYDQGFEPALKKIAAHRSE